MSGRKLSRRTLWGAVCLGSVLAAGVMPVSAGAASAPAPSELVKGASLPYRVTFLPEPSPAPSNSFGADVTDAGTLLVWTSLTATDLASELQEGNGLFLTSRAGGVKALANPNICSSYEARGWKALKVNASGTVLAEGVCLAMGVTSLSRRFIAQWDTPVSRPRIIHEGPVMDGAKVWVDLNNEGAILWSLQQQADAWVTSHVTGGGTQARSLTQVGSEVKGDSLAQEGTVGGSILRWERIGPGLDDYVPVRRPFVAEGGDPQLTILDIPPGAPSSVPRHHSVNTHVAPSGNWLLSVVGSAFVSWDAQRKASLLGIVDDVRPVNILDDGRALMWSSSGASILKGKTLNPLQITGLPSGGSVRAVTRINVAGQIAATVALPNGHTKAVLLDPAR